MDIQELIIDSLDQIEHERQVEILYNTMPVYNSVCVVCGTVFPVRFGDPLYSKCAERRFLDAIPLEDCENCRNF